MDSTNEDAFKAPLRSGPPVIKEGPIADLNYEEPEWSGTPPSDSKLKYELEVLKNGVIIETYPLTGKKLLRSRSTGLRLTYPRSIPPSLDIMLLYSFDLELASSSSTLNQPMEHFITSAVSFRGRSFHCVGPDEDSEPEGSMEAVKELLQKKKLEKLEEKENPEGISWGMREDAVDDNDTLKNWFEREGYELDYKVEEKGHSNFLCSVDIPTDTGGAPYCREACKLLDRRGILRASSASSKRKSTSKNWEEMDYYDSDDDEFLDRTGNIQEKALKTYEKLKKVKSSDRVRKVQSKVLERMDMDDYVNSLNGGAVDKHTINKLKTKFNELKRESLRLDKLIELTKPSNMVSSVSKPSEKKVFSGGVMIGKRFGGGIFGKNSHDT
ncbi:unnamed protein product [Lepeophtheirus salmonis]|uniref:(salmon louse) hypothetical protein n=1 Tax=Lepeophtheirus salmonis TaxID=72036 RepID=A0A7R8HDY6_LEPSM|nr:unnamed protein product [Lepeophtheirus salmonis]CAF3044394.1 unnamed protein product [Lepeophtheirus salmonis]